MLVISATSSLSEKQDSDTSSPTQEKQSVTEDTKNEDSFSFSESDENLLSELGFTDITVEDVTENGRMRIITAKIFDSEDLQLNITQENDTIIYVQLAGIVEDNDVVSNRSDKLDLDVGLQGQKTVDMYSDTDGGILAVLNWQDKTIRKAN